MDTTTAVTVSIQFNAVTTSTIMTHSEHQRRVREISQYIIELREEYEGKNKGITYSCDLLTSTVNTLYVRLGQINAA